MKTKFVMNLRKTLVLGFCLFAASLFVNAQEKEKMADHPYAKSKWAAGKTADSGQVLQGSYFQDRRAKKWSVGLMGGITALHGDADKKQMGYNFAPFVKYSISQTFALRGEYNFGMLRGERDYQNPTFFKDNFRFRTNTQDWNIQAHFTLGNISFLRPLRKTQMYLYAGIGQGSYKANAYFVDQRLFTGDYYFTTNLGRGTANPNLGKNVTESYEGRHLIIPLGVGFKHYISKSFDLGLEYRYTYLRSDDIDVYNTAIWANRWWDSYSFLRASFAYKFGSKNAQHYDWLSPVESIYEQVADIKKKTDCLGVDDDKDHVSNCFDQDNTTPDSCMVYGNGMAVDSDGDGVPDCQDAEPFSDKGAIVDATGASVDSDGDGIADHRDRENNSSPGALVDANGIEIKMCCSCEGASFPPISISSNCLTKEVKNMLYAVADKMRQCPENKLVLNGPGGKSSKYNAAGNTRCMEEIVKFLNEKFGISRDRIITNYNAGTESKNTIELIIK
jgi:hypothetical protein